MKLTKRLVAVVLAILMVLSTVSVSAFAWNAKTDDGFNLGIQTKIFRKVKDEWIVSDKFVAGEDVKVGVYLDTDYYAGSGSILLYYEKAFFESSVGTGEQTLTVNSTYGPGSKYGITGRYWIGEGSDAEIFSNDLVSEGLITADYTATHAPIYLTYQFGANTNPQMFDGEKKFCEIPLKVKSDATGTGCVDVLEEVTCNTTDRQFGAINITKGSATELSNKATEMWNWDAVLTYDAKVVELFTNCVAVNFDTNKGQLGLEEYYFEGEANENIEGLVDPTRAGYNFLGWKVDGAADETAAAVTVYPDADTNYVAVWDLATTEGNNVNFRTEIYRYDEEAADWVATDKVMPGETVKARVFVDTDYLAGGANLIAFYNGDFFEDSFSAYPTSITFNPSPTGPAAMYGLSGNYFKASTSSSIIKRLVSNGYVTQEFVNKNPAVSFGYSFPAGANCQIMDGTEWICEFELKVKENAIGTGDFFFVDTTIVNPEDGYEAQISVSRQSENSTLAQDASPMHDWVANATVDSTPVAINNTITFNANGGAFDAENTEEYVVSAVVGEKVDYSTIPEIARPGYTFMGWVDASIENPTIDDVATLPATMPYNSDSSAATKLVYNAFWVSEVDVTFAILNPETEVAEEIDKIIVTAGDPFVAPEDPTLEGYSFVGWTKEVEFKAEGGVTIGNISGLDAVYPTEDTTYYAIFTSRDYFVTYYVANPETQNFEVKAEQSTEYGAAIPAIPSTYEAPLGYVLSPAYEDVSFTTVLADGKTMPAENINLYYKLIKGTYDAIFNTNDGAFADGETSKTVSAVYEDKIVAPEDPVRTGYEFNGWEPTAETMDPNVIIGTENGKDVWGMVFEATWTPIEYNVTYYVDGTVYENYPVYYAEDLDAPADPYKEGYTFLGWAEEADSDVIATLPTTMPASDVDYYAVFDANEYTITFTETGDSVIDPITQDYGTEIPEVADPTLEGYTFTGWVDEEGNSAEIPATMPAEDITLKATWQINTYTVTWIVDGAETPVDYAYGTVIEKADDPVKTGYTFTGWAPEFAEGTTMPAEDLTYTAVFEANTYDAIFNAVEEGGTYEAAWADGEATKTVPTVFDEAIVAPAAPERTGYTFAGWTPAVGNMDEEGKTYYATWTPNADTEYTVEFYTMNTDGTYNETADADSTTVLTGESDSVIKLAVAAPKGFYLDTAESSYDDNVTIAPDGSTVVTVYYARNEYTITFLGNEGTVDGAAEVTNNYRYGAAVAVPAVAREGYTFKGWDKEVNLTAVETVVYTAQWEINQYTITFGNTGDTVMEPITQDYGTPVATPTEPTKLGHEFDKWDKEVPATMPAEDITINAEWITLAFDAIFDANTGAFEDASTQKTVEDITFGNEITDVADMPVKEGYTFKGWALEANATEALAPLGTMDAEGKTFYAVWAINQYTITFADTGDSVIDPITQDYGTAITAPEDPTKAGYTFTGWDALPSTMPADNVTVTAQWDANEYTITFGNTGDTVIEPITQDYGTAITAPADPEKEGYEFAGWEPAVPETMPLDGAEINATWAPLTDRTFTVVVHYTDIASGDKTAEFFYENATTEQAIEIVDAAGENADTYYVFNSDLAVAGYELDAADERNELTGVVAADNSTVLDLYYVAKKVTATFNAGDGKFVYYDVNTGAVTGEETTYSEELVYNDLVINHLPANVPVREGYTFDSWQGVNDTLRLTGDRTFNAVWTPNKYKVTWDIDGDGIKAEEDDAASFEETYEYEGLINKKVAESIDGYTFVEWVDENGAAVTIPNNMPAKDLTFIAKYAANEYTITFNTDGGSAIAPITQDYGTEIPAVADPTKEGYTFAGWVDGNGEAATVPATMPAGNVDLKATWTVNNYTVNYNVKNPVTGEFEVVSTNNAVAYNSPITAVIPAADYTVPDGYVISAAYTDEKCTELLAANATMPAADKNLYYKLEAIDLDAVFDANGGKWDDGDTTKTVVTKYNAAIVAPAAPTLEGNTFAGWAPAVGTMDDVNGKTFVAQWTPNEYTLSFDADGGTKVAPITQNYGTAITAPADPTKTGYDFVGWTDTADGTTAVALPTTMPAGNKTYYAIWDEAEYTITFNTDGGSTVAPITQDYGTAITAPAAPTKEGYTFIGWDALPTTMPAENVTVTAQWAINSYTVVWNLDGLLTTETYNYGATIYKPLDPIKTGYTFAGWSPAVPATMPAENQTFTATWTPVEYNVKFIVDGTTISDTMVDYGTAITVPENPTKEGYTFGGWLPTVPTTMPAENLEFNAYWADGVGVLYKVNVYEMDTAGGYPEAPTHVYAYSGVTGAAVTHNTTAAEGFHLDTTAANVLEGAILANGSLELVVYYARDQYTITFDNDNDGTADVSTNYLHGSTVTAPADPSKEGHTFNGWKETATGEGIALTATKSANYAAQWIANYYTITFNSNNGSVVAPITAPYGTEITAPTAPTKEGYDFQGWAETADGTTPATLPKTMPVDGDTYYAIWTPTVYTVTYYTEKDMTEEKQHYTRDVGYLNDYNVPTDPAKTGYTFAGWYNAATNASAGLPAAGMVVQMPLNGADYYATWIVNEYDLVYMPNGGTIDGNAANQTFKVAYGTAKADMPTVAQPERVGYTFTGWNAELPETMPANRVNIQAQWQINSYDVTFNAGEGLFTLDDDTTTSTITTPVEYNGMIEEPSQPARPGYTFEGWDAEIPVEMPAEGLTFNAVWSPLPDVAYSVEHYFMLADGTYAATADETEAGSGQVDTQADATANIKTVDNFTFDAEASTVTGNIEGDGSLVLKIYYTRESNTFKVYDDKNGNVISEQEVLFEAPISVPADEDMIKEGYTFAGWTDATGAPITVPTEMPGEALDVYASWTVNAYKVNFDANSGAWADAETVKTSDVNYGADVETGIPAEEPTKAGYTFDGWYDATTADAYSITDPKYDAMTTEELTFYAKWNADQRNYAIEIYQQEADGTMPTTPTKILLENAAVDETVSVDVANIFVPTGLVVDAEESELTGTVPVDGTLTLKVVLKRAEYTFVVYDADGDVLVDTTYLYDQTVAAVDSEVNEGYTFKHWSYTANGEAVEYPTRMPNNNVTLYAVWDINKYNVTFNANGGLFTLAGESTTETIVYEEVVFGSAIVAPTEAINNEGYAFDGWSLDGKNVIDITEMTMGDAAIEFKAVWSKTDFTVTFYTYEALNASPFKSDDPTVVVSTGTYQLGDKIDIPAATLDDIIYDGKTYYTFKGWSTTENGTVLTANELYNQTMPASDMAYYAVYERVKVQLISKAGTEEGQNTVIDRAGLTVDDYDAATSHWYVYGLETYMTMEDNELASYIDVSGDGYYVVSKLGFDDQNSSHTSVGTGTVIDVYDNVTGELVESFWIIIYGDINGDGIISEPDAAMVDRELASGSSWSREDSDEYVHYKNKAAVITGSRLQAADLAVIDGASLGYLDIDQVTGRVAG